MDSYGRSGRFHYLDQLAEQPQPWQSPRPDWHELEQAIVKYLPELLADLLAGSNEGWQRARTEINAVIAAFGHGMVGDDLPVLDPWRRRAVRQATQHRHQPKPLVFRDVSDDQVEGVLLNSQTRAVTVPFVALAMLGLFIAVSDLHDSARIVEGVVVTVVNTALGVRTARSSIKWNRQRLIGRWTGPTRRLAWSQIAGFEYREASALGARLRDGRWVRLMPYPRSPLNKPEQAIATLEAARQAAEQRGRAS